MDILKHITNLTNPFISAAITLDNHESYYGLHLLKFLVDNNFQKQYDINEPIYIQGGQSTIYKSNIADLIIRDPDMLYNKNAPSDILNTLQTLIDSGLNIQFNIEEYHADYTLEDNEDEEYERYSGYSNKNKNSDAILSTKPELKSSIAYYLSKHEQFNLFILKNIKRQTTQEKFSTFVYENKLLHIAVKSELYECISYLINECKLDINHKTTSGETPIMAAKNVSTLAALSTYNIDWMVENNEQVGLLGYFNRINDTKTSTPMIAYYFKQTKNSNSTPIDSFKIGERIQDAISKRKPNSEILLLMKNYKGNLNDIRNENNENILITSIKRGKWALAAQLIEKIDLNVQTNDHKNAFLCMLEHKNISGMSSDKAPIILNKLIKNHKKEHTTNNITHMLNLLLRDIIPNYLEPKGIPYYQKTNLLPSEILNQFISKEDASQTLASFNEIEATSDNKKIHIFNFFIKDYITYTKIPHEELEIIINGCILKNAIISLNPENNTINRIDDTFIPNLKAVIYLAKNKNVTIKTETLELIGNSLIQIGTEHRNGLNHTFDNIVEFISTLYTTYPIAPREELYNKINQSNKESYECDSELKTIINRAFLNNRITSNNDGLTIKKHKI